MGEFISAHNRYLNYNNIAWHAADFNSAQDKVKKAEGGYSNDTRDPGNYIGGKIGVGKLIGTNWGISAPVITAYWKANYKKEPTEFDVKTLPYSTALKIYKSQYWNTIKGNDIKNQELANMIYDSSVNQGPVKAKKYVVDSLGIPSYDVAKINAANPDKLFNKIGAKREIDYKKIGGYALNSWLKRLTDVGYTVGQHKKKTAAIILGVSILATGIYLYKRSN